MHIILHFLTMHRLTLCSYNCLSLARVGRADAGAGGRRVVTTFKARQRDCDGQPGSPELDTLQLDTCDTLVRHL